MDDIDDTMSVTNLSLWFEGVFYNKSQVSAELITTHQSQKDVLEEKLESKIITSESSKSIIINRNLHVLQFKIQNLVIRNTFAEKNTAIWTILYSQVSSYLFFYGEKWDQISSSIT